jgi:Zn-dependent protease with chaperone function
MGDLPAPRLLVAGTLLAAALVATVRQWVLCGVVPPGCRAGAVLWSLACAVEVIAALGLLVLVSWRALQSVRRQRQHTWLALEPLLSLPAVPASADLADVLGALHLETRTQVVDLDTPVAVCYGLLRPRLVLSTGLPRGLSRAELEAVVCHERAHLRRRDPLRLALVRALAEALPTVPALRQVAAAVAVEQELAADRDALAVVGVDALGGALLKVGDALGPLHGHGAAIGAFSTIDARIDQLLGAPPRLSPPPRTIPAALVVLLLSPLFCVLLPLLWCLIPASAVLTLAGRQWRTAVMGRPDRPDSGT